MKYVDSKLEKYYNGYELLMNFDDMQKVYDTHMYIICLCLYHFVAWLLKLIKNIPIFS